MELANNIEVTQLPRKFRPIFAFVLSLKVNNAELVLNGHSQEQN